MFDLSGKVAVVTGCRRGIGLAMAHALASAGADIIGVSAQLEAEGSEAQISVESVGRRFTALRADLGDRAAVKRPCTTCATQRAGHRHPCEQRRNDRAGARSRPRRGHLGPSARGQPERTVLPRPAHRAPDDRARAGEDHFHRVHAELPGRGPGAELHRRQVGGRRGRSRSVQRVGAAGHQRQRDRSGYIATDNTKALRADALRNRAILERIPAGRWGEPSDLSGATVFLASRASDYVCGTVLPIDGGWLAR